MGEGLSCKAGDGLPPQSTAGLLHGHCRTSPRTLRTWRSGVSNSKVIFPPRPRISRQQGRVGIGPGDLVFGEAGLEVPLYWVSISSSRIYPSSLSPYFLHKHLLLALRFCSPPLAIYFTKKTWQLNCSLDYYRSLFDKITMRVNAWRNRDLAVSGAMLQWGHLIKDQNCNFVSFLGYHFNLRHFF